MAGQEALNDGENDDGFLGRGPRGELKVRRPTGQVFRFSARQAVAGGHKVFAVETDGDLIVVLTGASGSQRPSWKVRYTQTGTYSGTSAL